MDTDRGSTAEARQRVVVGVDGSDGGREALSWALAEARLRGAQLDVVTAWEYPYEWSEGSNHGGSKTRTSFASPRSSERRLT